MRLPKLWKAKVILSAQKAFYTSSTTYRMANSKWERMKDFEQPDNMVPNNWIVVRIDGRGFSKFTTKYDFEKPNDRKGLDLMNEAAKKVMLQFPELVIAYGISDEYSFVFHKHCTLFERRSFKLATTIATTFTGNYIVLWPKYFPDKPLSEQHIPSFDGRVVALPGFEDLQDYMRWRQADCHINNLYNTTFWALIQRGGLTNQQAHKTLSGSVSADKNEILFAQFGINYNNEPEMYKKGSIIYKDYELVEPDTLDTAQQVKGPSHPVEKSKSQAEKEKKMHRTAGVVIDHVDLIQEAFWEKRPWIQTNKPGKIRKEVEG